MKNSPVVAAVSGLPSSNDVAGWLCLLKDEQIYFLGVGYWDALKPAQHYVVTTDNPTRLIATTKQVYTALISALWNLKASEPTSQHATIFSEERKSQFDFFYTPEAYQYREVENLKRDLKNLGLKFKPKSVDELRSFVEIQMRNFVKTQMDRLDQFEQTRDIVLAAEIGAALSKFPYIAMFSMNRGKMGNSEFIALHTKRARQAIQSLVPTETSQSV